MEAWSNLAKIALKNCIVPRNSGYLTCDMRDEGMWWEVAKYSSYAALEFLWER